MEEPASRLIRNRLLRDAEHHFDRHNFDDLLELASNACLREQPEYSTAEPELSAEQAVIARLGLRGINLAFDTIAEPDMALDVPSVDDKGNEVIGSWLPLRSPDLTNGQLDFTVQEKIDTFGTALLNEAYRSLGHEVSQKIHEFNSATSAEDEIAVLNWVNQRVRALKRASSSSPANGETESDELSRQNRDFYHPAMLSPKMLGRYPWNRFDPTCLGKSILTASFAAQTKAASLHAGVVRTEAENNFRTTSTSASIMAEKAPLAADSLLRRKLETMRDEQYYGDRDPGFHAATLVQLMDGRWYILDPNYESRILDQEQSAYVTKAFEDIESMDGIAKGTERIVAFDSYDESQWFGAVLFNMDIEPDANEIAELLDVADPETLQQSVWEWFLAQVDVDVITKSGSNMYMRELINTFNEYEVIVNDHYEIGMLPHNFLHAFYEYVLWDDTPEVMLERFKTDAAYRQRRIEDMRALPYAVLLSCQMQDCDARIRSTIPVHAALEVGKPSYRVGAAVLSDFATYCGDDMSYSFWAAHWPSLVPITERFNNSLADHEAGLAQNNMHWLGMSLRYTKQDGIVYSFLSGDNEE